MGVIDTKSLVNAGLSASESLVYLALLKRGTATVKDIAKDSGFHRTNIYDVLEQLKEKGLVSMFREGKISQYRASNPLALQQYLREKQEWLAGVLPDLQALQGIAGDQVVVDVFKGDAGMKTAFNEMLRLGEPLYAFGVRGQLREKLPIFAAQWIREQKAQRLPYYAMYTSHESIPHNCTEVRLVAERDDQPVATFIYGDNVCINIWSPALVAIVIRSKEVAQTYKRHFDLMWAVATPVKVPSAKTMSAAKK
jgi:DNA-binding transcriptional ArsR family regulator